MTEQFRLVGRVVTTHCLLHRKELGWDIERILTTPLKGGNNGKAKL